LYSSESHRKHTLMAFNTQDPASRPPKEHVLPTRRNILNLEHGFIDSGTADEKYEGDQKQKHKDGSASGEKSMDKGNQI